MGKHRIKPNYRRRVLRLPDLDHCKLAVLNSLGSPASRRVYEYAIEQFIAWYCSEPRLAFNRIVVVRYRMHLESRGLAANTINQQLAAARRLAHEDADSGLLSPELAAGISRVKGVKQFGFRSGNWLSAEQSSAVLKHASGDRMQPTGCGTINVHPCLLSLLTRETMVPRRLGQIRTHSSLDFRGSSEMEPPRIENSFRLANSLVPETLRQDCSGVKRKLFDVRSHFLRLTD